MDYAETNSLSIIELSKKRKEMTSEIFNLRMKNSIGQAPNPLVIRDLRRSIARINTAISLKKNVK